MLFPWRGYGIVILKYYFHSADMGFRNHCGPEHPYFKGGAENPQKTLFPKNLYFEGETLHSNKKLKKQTTNGEHVCPQPETFCKCPTKVN